MMFGWIVIALFVILGVWALIMGDIKRPANSKESDPPALKILKKRYAQGEISEEEYEDQKKHLEK